MDPELDRTQEAVRRELGRHGSLTTIDGRGVLATIMPGVSEGHFRVDREADGSWRLWGTYEGEDEIRVSGPVSGNALAALAGEFLLETRRRYCTEFGHPIPSPLPPPAIRARQKEYLAEETMQQLAGGTLPAAGNHGFDVLAPGGRRVQVKASVRNPKSGLISTLQFKTTPGYADHDELVYVEFSPDNYPLRAWSIESNLFRSIVPDDKKTHHVEPILKEHGTDITGPFVAAFESLFMSPDPEDRPEGPH